MSVKLKKEVASKMGNIRLSKRLAAVASCVQPGERLVDIGSDHAYLPCALVEQGVVPYAIAGEVAKGPLSRAKKEVQKRHLEDQIDVRLGNGLRILHVDDHVTTATICGMGGELIGEILEDAKQTEAFHHLHHLILQPNVKEHHVRRWLDRNGFAIVDEKLVLENTKYYELICATREAGKTKPVYSEQDYMFGVHVARRHPQLFIAKWQEQLHKKQHVLQSIQAVDGYDQEKSNELQQELTHIKERVDRCRTLLDKP